MARLTDRPIRSLLPPIVMLLALAGCGGDSAEALVKSGMDYADKRDYQAAIIQFKSALQDQPDSGEVRYLLGTALRKNGDVAAAIIELRKAASQGFDPEKVDPELVLALLEAGKPSEAIDEARKSRAQTPGARATLLALQGEAKLYSAKAEEAEALFRDSLQLDGTNPRAKLGQSKLAAAREDLDLATRLIDEVLTTDPDNEAAVFHKALLQQLLEKTPEAVELFERAATLRPSNLRAHFSLITLLADAGDLDAATTRLSVLQKIAPAAPTTVYLEALLAYRKGETTLARDLIREVLKVVPDYPPGNMLAGAIAHDLEAYAEAEEQLQKAVSSQPEAARPRRMLASTYARTGQIGKARATLDPLLKQPKPELATLLLAGELNVLGGDLRKAKEYFDKANAMAPDNTKARMRLGQLRLAEGDTARAIEDLQAASSLDPAESEADLSLVRYFLSRKEFEKALAAANTLLGKRPDDPSSHNVVGTVHLAKGDVAAARASFEKALSLRPSFLPAARSLAVLDAQAGDLDSAMARYEAVTQADPKQDEAWLELSTLKQQTGAPAAEVRDLIDRALAANPASVRAKVTKINYLVRIGDAKAAVAFGQEAHAAHPSNAAVLDALAGAQLKAMDVDQAIASYGKLAALMPKSGAPYVGLAGAHLTRGDWNGASDALRRATQIQPDWLPAREAQVLLGVSAQRFDYATAAAKSIQKGWPNLPNGYVTEADILAAQQRWSEAEAVLTDAGKRLDSAAIVTKLYAILDKQGKFAEADVLAMAWSARHAQDPTVAAAIAQSYVVRKDYKTAARWYGQALKAQPANALLLNNLAWCLGQENDPKALEVGKQALSAAPNSTAVLDTVGNLYLKNGDAAKAAELLRRAVEVAPRKAEFRLSLARALLQGGQKAEARKELALIPTLQASDALKQEAARLLSTL